MNKAIKINQQDNIIVALENLKKGETIKVEEEHITLVEDIQQKHKFTQKSVKKDDPLLMYGVKVGIANQEIPQGAALTTQNMNNAFNDDISFDMAGKNPTQSPSLKERCFMGYPRKDGSAGTQNIWLFFPLVFCENRNIELLKTVFEREFYPDKLSEHQYYLRTLVQGKTATVQDALVVNPFPNVEVRFITHHSGCGGTRADSTMLGKLLAGYVNNPNVAGASVLSLGCQNLQVDLFLDQLKTMNKNFDKPLLVFDQQKIGNGENLIQKIIKDSLVEIKKVNDIQREKIPVSKLTIGLECGGSDGFSGISANPTLGGAVDKLVALGGSALLSEFPELRGVEQELVDRCVDHAKAEKFIELMSSYENKVIASGTDFSTNPSPGNIKDGLITDAMKSAGAAKKGGSSPIVDVLDYGEFFSNSGLNLLCTPGNDVESTTAMAGSGANLIVFTTGLGTPTGNPVAPVIKVSSNTAIYYKMKDIIDFDTGGIIQGTQSLEELSDDLLEFIIKVASGKTDTKASVNRQFDFLPWKRDISL
ncbi:altronate dehydratase family protein [Flavobacteriaceae bacterium]|jgi:altronate hydrolase|nr:altronate dehydratase family protein [Flavobacteriaceae bacterium]